MSKFASAQSSSLRWLIALLPFIKPPTANLSCSRSVFFFCCLLFIADSAQLELESLEWHEKHGNSLINSPPDKAGINQITANFRLDYNPFRLLID
jgi:hypothetical protein